VNQIVAKLRARPLRTAAHALGLVAIVALALCFTAQPRHDRNWYPYLSHTAHAETSEQAFTITPISDWSYAGDTVEAETYSKAGYDFADLREVWFVLEPQPGSTLAAHTLLLFEFEEDRLLGLTIEARREQGESYSALRGAFNAFELTYVWASARDLLTRRAVMLEHDVYVYPIAISEEQKQMLLHRTLERTQSLETTPRFYNTLFSNCTNELAKAAGIDWHYSFILTGTSDEYLFEEGIIPGDNFEAANERAHLTQFIREANENVTPADFDRALLQRLRAD
jgi:hypothetical protein